MFKKSLDPFRIIELLRLTETLKLYIIRFLNDDRLFDRKAVR